MAKDMTSGNLFKILIRFSLPLVLSGLLQQFYNWADALIVGNIEGELSLAGIGATVTVYNLTIMLISGFSVGISVLTAQLYGEGKHVELKRILSTFTVILGAIFLILGLIGVVFSGEILKILETPNDILSIATSYLRIIFIAIPFMAIYNIYSAVLRGMGDSRTPFLSIVISSITNIALDILFVAVFRLGAAGAAIATVISQIFMTVFIVYYSYKKYSIMRFKIKKGSIDKTILYQGLSLGLPTGIQASIHSIGNLMLQNFMNGFGTQTVAAITTAYRVDSMIMLPIINLGSAISTVVAQNVGAKNIKRAEKSLYVGAIIIAAVSIVLTVIIIPTGETLVSLFGVTKEAAAIGKKFFQTIALFYLPFGIATAIKGFLEGTGDVIYSGIVSIIALLIRIILSYSLAFKYGNTIIALAEAISWVALLLMCIIRFLSIHKKSMSKENLPG